MDFKIRTTKTVSGNTAVQVINYVKRKVNLLKHIGSAKNEEEIKVLKEQAKNWISSEMNKKGLFKTGKDSYFSNYRYLGFTYGYAYEFLGKIYHKFNFQNHVSSLFKDLVIARIMEPKSKRDSLEFLHAFLGITHSENILYKLITKYDKETKDSLEKEIVKVAVSDFGVDFSFVLYAVTSLYF